MALGAFPGYRPTGSTSFPMGSDLTIPPLRDLVGPRNSPQRKHKGIVGEGPRSAKCPVWLDSGCSNRRGHPTGASGRVRSYRGSARLRCAESNFWFRCYRNPGFHMTAPARTCTVVSHVPCSLPRVANRCRYREGQSFGASSLLSRQEHRYSRGDDRERIARARQAAEALFSVKPPVSVPSVADAAADQSSRKPRVLRVTSPPPTGVEEPKASRSALNPLSRRRRLQFRQRNSGASAPG